MGPPAGSGSTHTVAMPTIHTVDTASVGLGLPPLSEDPATPWGGPDSFPTRTSGHCRLLSGSYRPSSWGL